MFIKISFIFGNVYSPAFLPGFSLVGGNNQPCTVIDIPRRRDNCPFTAGKDERFPHHSALGDAPWFGPFRGITFGLSGCNCPQTGICSLLSPENPKFSIWVNPRLRIVRPFLTAAVRVNGQNFFPAISFVFADGNNHITIMIFGRGNPGIPGHPHTTVADGQTRNPGEFSVFCLINSCIR